MSGYVFAVALCAAVVVFLFFLLRRRRIREKYAAIWICLAVTVAVLGAFPGVAFWLARLVGVETPVNLLFTGGFVILLVVCIQLSSSVTSLEEQTRTLTEELALLKLHVDDTRAVDQEVVPSQEKVETAGSDTGELPST